MKYGTVNVNPHATGVQAVEVPKGAQFEDAKLAGNIVQANYVYDNETPKEMAELRVVQNGVEFPNNWRKVDMLDDPATGQVTHLICNTSPASTGGRGPVATPVS